MLNPLYTTLSTSLSEHFELSNHRLLTFAVLIVGFANSRTVNLSHIAGHFPGHALISSNYRRLQRFFQYVSFDQDLLALMVVNMLPVRRKYSLALDRTNWKIGKCDVNILVLALVTERIKIPLLWSFLNHQGNSNTNHRIALMDRYIAIFGADSVAVLLADREFASRLWIEYLADKSIPFSIRIKQGRHIRLANGTTMNCEQWVTRKSQSRSAVLRQQITLEGSDVPVALVGKRIKREWLIVVTNLPNPRRALTCYKKRWRIECLFADAKTRGFNLEDTRMKEHGKLSTLLAVLTLAMAWGYCCANRKIGGKTIPRKSHGRRYKSFFRIGLDILRKQILTQPKTAAENWRM